MSALRARYELAIRATDLIKAAPRRGANMECAKKAAYGRGVTPQDAAGGQRPIAALHNGGRPAAHKPFDNARSQAREGGDLKLGTAAARR